MARYSDADKMKNAVMEYVNEYGEITEMFITDFNIMLERCSADVRENVRGEWKKGGEQPYFRKHFDIVVCSVCNKRGEQRWNFCPNCGADMRDNYENI